MEEIVALEKEATDLLVICREELHQAEKLVFEGMSTMTQDDRGETLQELQVVRRRFRDAMGCLTTISALETLMQTIREEEKHDIDCDLDADCSCGFVPV